MAIQWHVFIWCEWLYKIWALAVFSCEGYMEINVKTIWICSGLFFCIRNVKLPFFYEYCCIMVPHSPRAFVQNDLHVWADVGVAKTTNPRIPHRRKHCGGGKGGGGAVLSCVCSPIAAVALAALSSPFVAPLLLPSNLMLPTADQQKTAPNRLPLPPPSNLSCTLGHPTSPQFDCRWGFYRCGWLTVCSLGTIKTSQVPVPFGLQSLFHEGNYT